MPKTLPPDPEAAALAERYPTLTPDDALRLMPYSAIEQRQMAANAELMARLDAPPADAEPVLLEVIDPPPAPETGPGGYGWSRQHAYNASRDACLAEGSYDDEGDLNRCAIVGDADALARLRWLTGTLDPWFAESDDAVESGPVYVSAPA